MKSLIFSLSLVFLFTNPSFSQEKKVSLATLYGYSPYTMYKKGKKGINESVGPGKDSGFFQGLAWDIVREAYHVMGFTIELKVSPWARALQSMKDGRVDCLFPTTKTKEREKEFFYSTHATNSSNILIYTTKKHKIPWSGLSSMGGKRIGLLRGWSYGDEFDTQKNKMKLNVSSDLKRIFNMLDVGRLDGVVGYEVPTDLWLTESGISAKFIKYPHFANNYEFLTTLKNNKVAIEKIKAFDLGMVKIQENGIFDKVLRKWKIDRLRVIPQ